ncbi:MAG TPA: flagellar assembly protein FliH [Spirochaetia bacterium]|nr:flagellar assembly protein FliH [Spirochaetia bacterium]
MAKNVFKPQEIMYLSRKIFIEPPRISSSEEPAQPVEVAPAQTEEGEFTGPTVEDLRREAEAFRKEWEIEKQRLLSQAQEQADRIKKEAEQVAFDEVKRKNNQAQKIRQEAEDQAQKIVADARQKAAALEEEVKGRVAQVEKEATERGQAEGHAKGYEEGRAEVARLVESLHAIIAKAIEKRNEIIEEAETQIINLVLLIVKKVIKVISENQKNVVINNVVQALRKLKSRGDVVIRVNLADLELTSEHVKDFMKMVENVKSITVLEDSSVDRGGCIIETDFGQIDARISSQLHEIEERILELMPIRSKGE